MNEKVSLPSSLVSFFRVIPSAAPPQRADRSVGGTLPTRAFRYCDPVTTASAFGWWVFPPITFSLLFDGTELMWSYEGAEKEWYPLSNAAQFPGFAAHFDQKAPADIRGYSPPFLTAFVEPGIVQIWSGLFARTAPGVSLLIRPVANFARSQGYQLYEGIVETDTWFGPLFTNARLTRTAVPIEFKAELPLFQLQPVQRSLYEGRLLDDFTIVDDMSEWSAIDWDNYRNTVVAPNTIANRSPGQHAVKVRRRRRRLGVTSPTNDVDDS
jgi:Family of unknown function (DUF6065)